MVGRRGARGLGFICAFVVMAGPAAGAARAAPQIYWGNLGNGTVGAADLDGGNANQSFMTGLGGGGQELFALAVDGQHIYWCDLADGTIGVANLDGSVVNATLISGISGVDAIAVNAHHIYWANAFTNTIGEANLDGTAVNPTFITLGGVPFGLAVNGQHLYWTNTSANTIGEANLDGSDVNQTFITGAQGIFGLALDGEHLYWANDATQTIGRANLDGTDVDESFITGAGNPFGVAVDGQDILWTNQKPAGTIGAAPLQGGSGQLGFITGANSPLSLAVSVPVANVNPASPAPFANTSEGSVSGPTTVTVTNTGQATLQFTGTSVSLTGTDPDDFQVGADSCVGGVAPGASCQVDVYFSPQAVGARSATLQIASNDYANGPIELPLAGTGTSAPAVSAPPTGSASSTQPTPPQGSNTPQDPSAPIGAQAPAAKIDLISCRTVTKTVSKKVNGKTRELTVKRQKCSHKLLSGGAGRTTGASSRATLSRGRVTYAVGTGVQLAGGRSQLVVTELRPLRPGNYTLTLRKQRTKITLG